MEALLQDLRLSCRLLAKNPGFTAVAVLCMALGIGANTTVYSIVEAALFRPFPFAEPGRIVALHRSRTQEPSNDSFSYLDLLDLQRQAVTLSSIAGYASQNLTFAGNGDEPERVAGQRVSAELLPLLGGPPSGPGAARPAIGVRMALGARHRHVLAMVIGQALALTAAGIACGIAAALGVNRLLGRLLYEISPTDPASYALIALFLAGVAVLASALPARRALDADPLEALRHE